MNSLARSFTEARDAAHAAGEYRLEGCGWLSPELQADLAAFERDLADHRERIATAGRELADIRTRLGMPPRTSCFTDSNEQGDLQ